MSHFLPSEDSPRAEGLSISSAAGTTSRQYDMQGYDRCLIMASIKGDFTTVTVDLMESSVATAGGTSAAGSKAGMVLGAANATALTTAGGCAALTLTISSDTTGAQYFTVGVGGVTKRFTHTASTANLNATAWTSTSLYYGSTVGTTAATGLQLRADSLKTAMASTLGFGDALTFSTGTTATLGIVAGDKAAGPISLTATAAVSAQINEVVGGFNIAAAQLDSTANKRYVSMKISSAATSANVGVSVIRTAGAYKPGKFIGKLST